MYLGKSGRHRNDLGYLGMNEQFNIGTKKNNLKIPSSVEKGTNMKMART